MDPDDSEERRRAVAMFRHAVIAELDVEKLDPGELSERITELAHKTFVLPSGRERSFSKRTLWSWWSAYKKGGLTGLMPKARSDRGVARVVEPRTLQAAVAARREVPARSTATVIDVLEKQGAAPLGKLKRATLDRHLHEAGMSRRRLRTLGSKRHIRLLFARPNQLWVGDYHEAPLLFDPQRERYRTVHLSAFIDHYSKVVPHGQWYDNERLATLEDSFKKATLKRGLPEKVYVDRGSVYRSGDFAFALDHFDIKLCYSRRYVSEGRGVIERFNRTIADQFEPEARAECITALGQLNCLFEGWLEQRYHLTRHEATGEPPVDRFARAGFTPRYPDPVDIQDIFRVRVRRKVHPKTSTVEVAGVHFVVETFLRSRWVSVHYDPHRLDDVLIYRGQQRIQRAFPQQPNEPPLPPPERPTVSPPSFHYLAALRAAYDQRIVAEARQLSFSDWQPTTAFALPDFLTLCTEMLGKDLSPYERDDLALAFNSVGPFSETTARRALQHALRLRGRGLHVSVYSHYLKVFQLEALRAFETKP
jgi:putative transposase